MNKVYRSGSDLLVALDTARAHRLALHWTEPAGSVAIDGTSIAPGTALSRNWRLTVKRAVRLPFKLVFRAVKPILSPLVFRMRRYFVAGVQDDLRRYHEADQHTIERVSADILRETQASREQLRQELLGGQQQALAAQRKQFETRICQMEDTSPQRLVHLFERMVDMQQEAFTEQRHQFDERIAHFEDRIVGMLTAQKAWLDQQHALQAEHRTERQARLDELLASQTVEHAARQAQHVEQNAQQALEHRARFDRLETYSYASARRVVIPSGDGRILIKTEAGYVVCPADDLAVVALLAESGDLEPGTRKLIGRLLTPGDVYVDVGANLGMHTIAAGHAMENRGKIVAFEPFPRTRKLLQETLHVNGMHTITTVHQAAVSDRAGRHIFYLGNTCGHHSLFALTGADASDLAPIEVDTVRLDDVLSGEAVVTLIKIDAEGAELDVLHGAAAMLAAHQDVGLIVEFGISHLARNGITTTQWLSEFATRGLVFKAIEPNTGVLQHWEPSALEEAESINLLFARPGSPLWDKAVIS